MTRIADIDGRDRPFRNRIINGSGEIVRGSMRNLGTANIAAGAFLAEYGPAMWRLVRVGSYVSNTRIVSRPNNVSAGDLPANDTNLSIEQSNGSTAVDGSSLVLITTRVEKSQIEDAWWSLGSANDKTRPLVFSFWARSSEDKTHGVTVRGLGSAGTTESAWNSSFSVTNLWRRFAFLIPPPPSGSAFDVERDDFQIAIDLTFSAGSNVLRGSEGQWSTRQVPPVVDSSFGTGTAFSVARIAQMQLEVGRRLTPFEVRPRYIEAALVERYVQGYGGLTFNQSADNPLLVGQLLPDFTFGSSGGSTYGSGVILTPARPGLRAVGNNGTNTVEIRATQPSLTIRDGAFGTTTTTGSLVAASVLPSEAGSGVIVMQIGMAIPALVSRALTVWNLGTGAAAANDHGITIRRDF